MRCFESPHQSYISLYSFFENSKHLKKLRLFHFKDYPKPYTMSYERLNAYQIMWLFVMFDLPVKLKKDQKAAAQFRKNLEKDGFTMYQYSIYIRHCGSLESAEAHTKRVKSLVPAKGHVSVLSVTDKQFSEIVNFWGKIEEKKRPIQLELEFF